MSGFFSLGGIGIGLGIDQDQHHQQNQEHRHHPCHQQGGGEEEEEEGGGNNAIISPNSLFLFKNEEIYSKGFELWQQYYQLHQHHRVKHHQDHQQQQQQHQQQPQQLQHHDLAELGVGPSCRRTTTITTTSSSTDDHHHHHHNNNIVNLLWTNNNNNNNNRSPSKLMRPHGGGFGIGGDGGGGGTGMNCQDCGNQAKKDCQHVRCRTCCKSRGFQCQTHIKSTWVPAAKRRERQQQLAALTQQQQHQNLHNQQLSLMMRAGTAAGDQSNLPKRQREEIHSALGVGPVGVAAIGVSSSLALPSTHHNSGLEVGLFPAEVSSPAVFRCVRVSAMDEPDEQFAYQAAVNIGGHVFKGILYDQGPDHHHHRYVGGESSAAAAGQHAQLNLITSGSAAASTAVTTTNNPGAVTFIDPSSIYPAPLNAFMTGTQFFPPPRP